MLQRLFIFIITITLLASVSSAMSRDDEWGQASGSDSKVFQKVQDALDKEANKKKVLEKLEKQGVRGIRLDDITVTLLNYRFHDIDDSGKPQTFITAKYHINLDAYRKRVEELRKQEPLTIVPWPDAEKAVFGVIDDAKKELTMLMDYAASMRPIVKFVKLRKNDAEYVMLTAEPIDKRVDEDGLLWNGNSALPVSELRTAVIGFDRKSKTYTGVVDLQTYEFVAADGPDGSIAYIDKSEVSWSDWINDTYRELIVTTKRNILSIYGSARPEFNNRKDIYGWTHEGKLSLVERIDDGKKTIDLR